MNNSELIDLLQHKKILTKSNKLNPNYKKFINDGIMDIIYNYTNFVNNSKDIDSLKERIYCIVHDTHPPTCKTCHATLKFRPNANKDEKYGSFCSKSCSTKHEHTQQKMKKTNIKKYGIDNPFNDQEKINKIKLKKYGTVNTSSLPEVKTKIKETFNRKYGGHPNQNEKIKQQNQQRMKTKKGVSHYSELLLSPKAREIKNNSDVLKQLLTNMNTYEIAELCKVSPGTVHRWAMKLPEYKNGIPRKKQSRWEIKICKWLDKNNINYEHSTKQLIKNQEIDIYIPEYKLAIEVNGIYWHGEFKGRREFYHLNKTKTLAKKDISLLHFTDYEIQHKWNVVESILRHKLNLINVSIDARETKCVQLEQEKAKQFFEINHIAGFHEATYHCGLMYDNQIVAAASFIMNNQTNNTELIRFCYKNNTAVSGGLVKLIKDCVNASQIIMCCDLRWSTGDSYISSGFSLTATKPPQCKYYHISNPHLLWNECAFKTHLSANTHHHNYSDVEWSNMKEQGYDRIWDCGSLELLYINN